MPETIIRLKPEIGALGENNARPRDPIGLLAVDQMPHHIEGAECVGTLSAAHPRRIQTVEQRAQGDGRTSQDLDRRVEIEAQRASSSTTLTALALRASESATSDPQANASAALIEQTGTRCMESPPQGVR